MKILYGVQATGNGHLSRARGMAKHFARRGADVTYLFSGRAREQLFGMEAFGDFMVRKGLTFSVGDGKVSYLKTAISNNPLAFLHDVFSMDLASYDLVLNDFEPVTAWAAHLRGKTVISFGHQPAFRQKIPVSESDFLARMVLKYFAPGNINIGLHWHHFGQQILPPIIHFDRDDTAAIDNKILVYLPFENQQSLLAILRPLSAWDFHIYAPEYTSIDDGHIHLRPISLEGFQHDLKSAAAVICNAGFELASECLQLGKKLLVKPVHNQMEQASNALALERLGLATTMQNVEAQDIRQWLERKNTNRPMNYPDVAAALVDWVLSGDWDSSFSLVDELWKETVFAR